MLVDIVSKNGNLLINVVQTPEGDLEPDVLNILEGIGQWIKINGEGIYGTRPWKVYGEGPSTTEEQEKGQFGGLKEVRPYQANDIRYTTKANTVYAFCLKNVSQIIELKSHGLNAGLLTDKVLNVSVLGSDKKVTWEQTNESLKVMLPNQLPAYEVLGIKIIYK